MKDWDFGEVRAGVGYGEDFKMNLKAVTGADARAGGFYLSIESCAEINEACNAFFRKRNMPVGKDFSKQFFNQRLYDQNKTFDAAKAGAMPEVSTEGGTSGAGGGAGDEDRPGGEVGTPGGPEGTGGVGAGGQGAGGVGCAVVPFLQDDGGAGDEGGILGDAHAGHEPCGHGGCAV